MDIALHDTNYVVAHFTELLGCSLLLPIAKLPAGFIEFSDLEKSEGTIRTTLIGKRGVYLWTNNINGHQYIGSAMDLSARLSDYFTKSYIKAQSKRGSAISLAIAKYGYAEFTLQVLVLGSSPIR